MNSAPTETVSPSDIRAGRRPFMATVVAVYIATFAFAQHPFTTLEIVSLLAAGGAYLVMGFCATEFYARTSSLFALAALYAVGIPLAGLIVYWMGGFFLAGLIMLPLAGLAVQALPHRWMLAVCALLVVALSATYGLGGGLEAAVLAGVGYLVAIVFVVFITQVAVRERRARAEVERLAAELAEANRKLREYVMQAEELAITRERARLAHEIHDTVGHTLTALDVQLELLARLPPGQTEQRRQVAEQTRALVKEGLADVRRAVQALRPAALESFSLPEAIASLVADFEQVTQISTTWQVEGKITDLPLYLALPLYRAAQETLTNIQRHAPAAQQATIQLHYGPEAVTLTVENDGVPSSLERQTFEVSEDLKGLAGEEQQEGYGLRGLRERAEALGGEFSARLDGAGGFRVEMSLPRAG